MMRAGDFVLIALCAALIGAAFAITWQPHGAATFAVVRAPDQPERRLALARDSRVAVHGRRGDSVIGVQGGRARFLSSPCSGKQCIHAGWLDAAGEFAACLPNGVSITMVGGESRYDALAY